MPAGWPAPAKKPIVGYVVIQYGDRPTATFGCTSDPVLVIPLREGDYTEPKLVIPVEAPKRKPRPYPEHLARPPWERRRR